MRAPKDDTGQGAAMKPPQFNRRSRDEYAEVLVNPNVVAQSDDGDAVVNMHPQSADSGPFINLNVISRIEVRYCERMPQVPGHVAAFSLEFGEAHPELATRMYVVYSSLPKFNILAYPVTPFTKTLERIWLDAVEPE
jgi:hypothetical protein